MGVRPLAPGSTSARPTQNQSQNPGRLGARHRTLSNKIQINQTTTVSLNRGVMHQQSARKRGHKSIIQGPTSRSHPPSHHPSLLTSHNPSQNLSHNPSRNPPALHPANDLQTIQRAGRRPEAARAPAPTLGPSSTIAVGKRDPRQSMRF